MKKLILALTGLFLTIPCQARTIIINSTGTGEYPTIQAAINDANDDDIIELQVGTYTGNGNRDIDFLGKAITVCSTNPNDANIVAATVIDCGGSESQPHRGFHFQNAEEPNSVVNGLTITNGYGKDEEISFHVCESVGGGIFTEYASPTITRCVIKDNQAPHGQGGGICCREGTPAIIYCTISNNSTTPYGKGGGIYSWDCSPEIRNCLITDNVSNGYGGGIYCNFSAPVINLCTIVSNSALYMGGGICAYGTESASAVKNSIIWDNTAPDGPGIKLRDTSYPTVSYCDIQGGFSGTGNFNVDPSFSNPTGGDYHLLTDSPCINAGDPCYVPGPNEKDIDGDDRVLSGRVDAGIDEVIVAGPVIGISTRNINFSADEEGPNPEPQLLYISNTGTGSMNWQIDEDCPWLSAIPMSGISSGEADEVTITVDISEVNQGLHECELDVISSEANNSPQTVYVSLYVYGNLPVPSKYPNIQAAINAAKDGDTVIVAPGTYSGPNNIDIDFKGKAITMKSENGPESCILDAEFLGRVFIFDGEEEANSIVDGFTIKRGILHCDPNVEICPSTFYGGGILCYSRPTICNCIFTHNLADMGGGIHCEPWGGPTILNCIFIDNESLLGAAICCSGDTSIINCTIVGNTASTEYNGSAVDLSGGSTIVNSIVWNNYPYQLNESGSGMATYNDIQGGWTGTGNINVNPSFANVGADNYHLKSEAGRWNPISQTWVNDSVTSPCIDAGNPNSDWTAELWPHGKRINMGAYGGTPQASMSLSALGNIADLDNDDCVAYNDMELFSEKWLVQQLLLPEDLDRNGFIDFVDFAILANEWQWP